MDTFRVLCLKRNPRGVCKNEVASNVKVNLRRNAEQVKGITCDINNP
jgi:hypothetical protein